MSTTEGALDRADRRAVFAVSWLSAIGLILTLVGLGVSISQILTSSTVTVANALSTTSLSLGEFSGGPVSASTDSVDVAVADAPASVRAPLVGAAIVGSLVPLAVTGVLFFAGRRVARMKFGRTLAFGVATLSAVTFGSAVFTPFLNAIAGAEALKLGPLGADAPFAFTLDGSALGVPTLLLLIAVLLVVSNHLQRETEGLV